MDPDGIEALTSFLEDRVGDSLRSVIHYEQTTNDYEIVFARDDVLPRYSAETIERLVQSYRWESAGKFVEEQRYDHGTLNAIVRSFEEGIESTWWRTGRGSRSGSTPVRSSPTTRSSASAWSSRGSTRRDDAGQRAIRGGLSTGASIVRARP